MVAQTDRGGLAKAGIDGVGGAGAGQCPHVGHHASLLAEHRHLHDVEDVVVLAQPVETHGEILGRLVVDLELDDRQVAVHRDGGRAAGGLGDVLVEDQRAEAVAETGQRARAEAYAGAAERAGALGSRGGRRADEVTEDSGAGGRDTLAGGRRRRS